MDESIFKNHHKYLVPFIFLIILVLTYLLLKPYFMPILWALFLTYFFYPIYKKLRKYIKNEVVVSAIMCLLITLFILIPVYFIVSIILKESFNVYSFIRTSDLVNILAQYNLNVAPYIDQGIQAITTFTIDSITNFIVSIPKRVLDLFIILFISFYLFRLGPDFADRVLKYFPKKIQNVLKKDFVQVSDATVYGHILTAIIQAVIGIVGLIIFKVPNPFLWGFAMFLLAMIPFLGPALIWFPASVYLYVSGKEPYGIGLFFYGLLLVSTIDNFIKPKLIGKKLSLHPAIILLGIIGGLSLFGLIGLFVGPLILALFISLTKIYFNKNEA